MKKAPGGLISRPAHVNMNAYSVFNFSFRHAVCEAKRRIRLD